MTHCDTQWMAAWLHKTMCSSFSFICHRPENPEHSWGYQTVLLCYLLRGRSESRMDAQVSTQKLCKSQCNFVFIDSERTWIYERDKAQVSSKLSWVLLSHELVSVNYIHMKLVLESGFGGAGPSCHCPHETDSPMPWDAVRAMLLQSTLRLLDGSCILPWISFKERCKYNQRDQQDLKEASTTGSEIPTWRSACLEAAVHRNWDKWARRLSTWVHV